MAFLSFALKGIVVTVVAGTVWTFVTRRWSRLADGSGLGMMVALLVIWETSMVCVEALDWLPRVGPWFAAGHFDTTLHRLDGHDRLASMSGLLLFKGSALAVAIPLYGLYLSRRRRGASPGRGSVLVLVVIWSFTLAGVAAGLRRIGFPDPLTKPYAELGHALALAAGSTWQPRWSGPALAVFGTFGMMAAIALVAGGGMSIARREGAMPLSESHAYSKTRWIVVASTVVGCIATIAIVLAVVRRVGLIWLPAGLPSAPVAYAVLTLLVVAATVTAFAATLPFPAAVTNTDMWGAPRPLQMLTGFAWAVMLVVAIVLCAALLERRMPLIQNPIGMTLTREGLLAALIHGAAVLIVFQGFALRVWTPRYEFVSAALLTALSMALVRLTMSQGFAVTFAMGYLFCMFVRLGGTLWLPLGFIAGWNLAGAVLVGAVPDTIIGRVTLSLVSGPALLAPASSPRVDGAVAFAALTGSVFLAGRLLVKARATE